MELRVLRYFLIVAREENITRAAQLLHITQPTLSRQLMQLEEELGVKLFHRSKHHIILTRRDSELGNKLVIKPEDLHVVPLSPALETGAVLSWKRNQTHASATSYFIKHIKNNLDI